MMTWPLGGAQCRLSGWSACIHRQPTLPHSQLLSAAASLLNPCTTQTIRETAQSWPGGLVCKGDAMSATHDKLKPCESGLLHMLFTQEYPYMNTKMNLIPGSLPKLAGSIVLRVGLRCSQCWQLLLLSRNCISMIGVKLCQGSSRLGRLGSR